VFAGFRRVHGSRLSALNGQSRPSSLTKINKEVISRGGAAANMHGDHRALRAATASVVGDALGIAGRQVFHRYALFVPFVVVSGSMAMGVGATGG
jgi:hypothetical protein